MEVNATQFRRDLFDLLAKAVDGENVRVTYKGQVVKLVPEKKPASIFDRITPIKVIPDGVDLEKDDGGLLEEMTRAWEKDWDEL